MSNSKMFFWGRFYVTTYWEDRLHWAINFGFGNYMVSFSVTKSD